MVRTFRSSSLRMVARPTQKRSSAGRGQTFSRKFSFVISVCPSGFFMSEPSLANTLLNEMPTEIVMPISSRTRRRSSRARAGPSFSTSSFPGNPSQFSSMP